MTSRERREARKNGLLCPEPGRQRQSADDLIKLGAAAWRDNKVDTAFEFFRAATALEPHNNHAAKTLGFALLVTGDFEGFKEYDRMWMIPDHPLNWRGEALNGETLLIQTDRTGFGDVIQYGRFVTSAANRGARVVMQVAPVLERLLSHIQGVAAVFSGSQFPLPSQYYRAQAVRLPIIFETTLATIPAAPYLKANQGSWMDVLARLKGFGIGLCWAGKSGGNLTYNTMDNIRSMRLADMAPLFSVPGCSFVSLQLGLPAAQLADLPPGFVHDVSDRLGDWQNTADLVAGLDLVITVDTAVAHLAGALGKPVWLLNRHFTCWRWMYERSDSPWYPSMRIFRQPEAGDWATPVAECVRELSSLLNNPVNGVL